MLLTQAEQLTSKIEIATPLVGSQRSICAVRGGDEIRVGRHVFEVVDLPGHTRGMAGLYDPCSGICFSGDQLLFIITPTTILSLDDADMVGLYRGSMQRLLDLHPMQVFHSHGEIRQDFEQRARVILESRARRADLAERLAMEACEQDRPPTGIELIGVLGWRIPFKSIDEAPLHQQWLIYAQGVTVLDYLVASERLVRMVDESRTCAGGNIKITHRYRPAD
jgi:glyoxylase-like metal-dependent hydrolase (beta-lactamase superfamily II)